MFAYSIINYHELTPGLLCNVIANKFHTPIQQLIDQVMTYFNLERQEDRQAPPSADLQHLLFGKMQTETSQLIRKESTVLFPVIRNASALNKSTKNLQPGAYDSIQQSFHKIILLLQKLRQVSSNYQLQQHWSAEYKICINDMMVTEQVIQQWIFIEQNILYPAAIPGHTIIVSQNEIDNVIID
jgi:iron-sulfur cluster repair protein YtfE (RIC family)